MAISHSNIKEWSKARRNFLLEEDIRIDMKLKMDDSGLSQIDWARKIGIPPQSLSDFMMGRRALPPKLRDYLGVEAVLVYRPKSELLSQTNKVRFRRD